MNYSKLIGTVILFSSLFSCGNEKKELANPSQNNLIKLNSDQSKSKFDPENKIYKTDRKFNYSYRHITKDGEIRMFKTTSDETWDFVNEDYQDSNLVETFYFQIIDEKNYPFDGQIPYAIKLNTLEKCSITGLLENQEKVWLHPPRSHYFKILEINPYPFIKRPFEIGNSWNWSLKIGEHWGDERWKTWDDFIENDYTYEITSQTNLKTELGHLPCYIIESEATSRIGKTYLKAYFNEEYGFVKLDYTNIDGSKTILELLKE